MMSSRIPRAPDERLWTHNHQGMPAEDGFAFNAQGQMVPLPYQPWMQGPQQPWSSFATPDYKSLMQGNSTIEMQPQADPSLPRGYGVDPMGRPALPTHQQVSLVPASAYMKDENPDIPTQDNGTLANTPIGARGDVARINYRLSKSLVGYIEVPSPDAEVALAMINPNFMPVLNVPPVQANGAVPPVGGAVAIAQISFGHKGVQLQVLFDTPQNQIIHVPFGGSFGILASMLAPKYYKNFDSIVNTKQLRQYLLTPLGGIILTNPSGVLHADNSALWNTLTQAILPLNISQVPQPLLINNPNTVPYQGWFAVSNGAFTNTTLTQPLRRFYGTVAAAVTPFFQNTRCPVAWYASQVTLIANPALVFFINGLTSAGGITQRWGPFPVNQPVTIPVGATTIDVGDAVGLGGAVNIEVNFELDYALSF